MTSRDFRALKEIAAGSQGGVGGAHLPHNLVVGDVQGGGRSFAGLNQLQTEVEAAALQVKQIVLAEGAASVEGRASKGQIAPKNSEAQPLVSALLSLSSSLAM
jgi:hypothetical protein